MSSSKLDTSGVFQSVTVQTHETQLTLPPSAVHLRKNGIEFRTAKPIEIWKEMTVGMLQPGETKRVQFTGVVVDCAGNRHAGYIVSMVFTSLSRQSQERLSLMVGSPTV
ncbi:MAG: hypothetical protein M1608_08810 [Candidatus Omnitrophica bacterium]|nr:hypothetical protein [Candidatus Omnitrophota bacterium]